MTVEPRLYFSISEFMIIDTPISGEIADKILTHIEVINPIREAIGSPVTVSRNSGYRPPWYEAKKHRNGQSEHCFKGRGAADYTSDDIEQLFDLLIQSSYRRVCYYPHNKFIHADFKPGPKNVYIDRGQGWIRQHQRLVGLRLRTKTTSNG